MINNKPLQIYFIIYKEAYILNLTFVIFVKNSKLSINYVINGLEFD